MVDDQIIGMSGPSGVLTWACPSVRLEGVQAATGWDRRLAARVSITAASALARLDGLRAMVARR